MIDSTVVGLICAVLINYFFIYPKSKQMSAWMNLFIGAGTLYIEAMDGVEPTFGVIIMIMSAIMLILYYFPDKL